MSNIAAALISIASYPFINEQLDLYQESKSNASSELDNIYQVKWIGWRSNRVPIITQNSNGPCPMLAIANILLLRGKMELQDGCEMVSSEQLIERLGMYV